MRKILFLILLIQISIDASAQKFPDINVKKGVIQKGIKGEQPLRILSADENGYIVWNWHQQARFFTSHSLTHFNKSNKKTISEEVIVRYKKKKLTVLGLQNIRNNIYAFGRYRDKKENQYILVAQKINKKTLKPEGTPIQISQVNDDSKALGEEKINLLTDLNAIANGAIFRYFKMAFSKDSSKVLICSNIGHKKNAKRKLHISVLNSDFKKVWEKNIEINATNKLSKITSLLVNDKGDAHIAVKVYYNKVKEYVRKKVNHDHFLYSYTNSGKKNKKQKINHKRAEIKEIILSEAFNNTIYCSSILNNLDGTYLAKLNPKSLKINSRRIEKLKNKTSTFRDYYASPKLKQVLHRKDGSIAYIVEDDWSGEVSMEKRRFLMAIAGCVTIVSLTEKGKIEWHKKLLKKQHWYGRITGPISYQVKQIGDNLLFLYNTHRSAINLISKRSPALKSHKKSVAILALVNRKGKLKYQPILNYKKDKVLSRPSSLIEMGTQSFVFVAKQSRKVSLCKIKLQNP